MSEQQSDGPDLGGLARGAAVFVVAMAAVFGVIGLARDDTGGTEILDDPVAAESTTEAAPTETATTTAPATPTETETATSTPTPTETDTTPAIDPSEITVQILDGTSGGDATDRVSGDLDEAGYDVVAINDSVNVYDQTTVFYTDGFEDQAQQIADEFGFDVVELKPDNLSDSVNVHLVVGEDA